MFRFIGPYIVPRTLRLKIYALLSLCCIIISKLCNLLPPFALKWAVDTLASNASRPADKAVVPLLAVFVFFMGRTLGTLFNTLRSITYAVVSTENTKQFSVNLFRHLQNLDLAYHMQRKTGEVNRIMDRGADSIDTLMNTFLFTLAPTYVVSMSRSYLFFPWSFFPLPNEYLYVARNLQIAGSIAGYSYFSPFGYTVDCYRHFSIGRLVWLVYQGGY